MAPLQVNKAKVFRVENRIFVVKDGTLLYICAFLAHLNIFSLYIAPPSKKLVQFRWIKSKPTLAREVYLISSLVSICHIQGLFELEKCFYSPYI